MDSADTSDQSAATIVEIAEAKKQLGTLIDRVRAGETIYIAREGEALVRIDVGGYEERDTPS